MGNLQPAKHQLTPREQGVVTNTWISCSAVSLSAISIVILCMVILQQYKKPHQQLVFTMFCFTFGIYFFGVIAGDEGISVTQTTFCTVAGFLFQLCWNANIVGVLAISVNLYRSIVSLKPMKSSSLPLFHFFIWTYSFFLSSLPLTTNSYGWAGLYCWLDSSRDGMYWRMITLYWPMIAYDAIMLLIYGMVLFRVVQQRTLLVDSPRTSADARDKPLIAGSYIKFMVLYPLVFFLFSTPALVNRYYAAYTGLVNYQLYVAQSVTVGLMGLAYSLVFGWVVLKHWREILIRIRLLSILLKERCCPQSFEIIRDSRPPSEQQTT